ncbi:zf-HC2 domain-containing protein [Prauserella cavernicola]|uniref:Zf-HC2 domain-containing protein n=1 Tax=Prauserella cavernicola TaxID=2800127 RepID=A0A934V7F3_9PSEU|nr:zf-HC2 domain-containing protein [Prauserella cavernicola]MBK1787644.1 zf-HC2 domain-containing protein [Prauserella cavernicola]
MDCSSYREALSARLDNEDENLDPRMVDQHLGSCASCRLWWEQAAPLHRAFRVAEAPQVPDLTSRIVAVATPPSRERWGLRMALAVIALAQAGLGFGQLLGMGGAHAGHATGAGHLGNESAAWNLAIGIGLLWAALRPKSAGGLLPALTGFAVVLGVVSVSDLVGGAVTEGRVLSHGIMLAGVVLLFFVHRQSRSGEGPAPVADGAEPGGASAWRTAGRDGLARILPTSPRHRPARGPLARRDAA